MSFVRTLTILVVHIQATNEIKNYGYYILNSIVIYSFFI